MLQPITNTVQSSFQLHRAVSDVFSTTLKSQPDSAPITPDATIQKPTKTGSAPETVFSPVSDRLYGGPPEMVFSPVFDRLYGDPPEMVFSPVFDRLYGDPPEMVFSPVFDRLYGSNPPATVFPPVPCQINNGTSKARAITNGTIQSDGNNVNGKSFNQTSRAETINIGKMLLEQRVYEKNFTDKEPSVQIIC